MSRELGWIIGKMFANILSIIHFDMILFYFFKYNTIHHYRLIVQIGLQFL